jgi:hypothetical protein
MLSEVSIFVRVISSFVIRHHLQSVISFENEVATDDDDDRTSKKCLEDERLLQNL